MSRAEFDLVQSGGDPPAASVVLPVYRSPFAIAALDSVLAQRDIVLEILVSDDASGDDTPVRLAERMRGYTGPHHLYLRQGKTRLEMDHIVLLAEAASCDLTIMAHHDDLAMPQRARTLVNLLGQTGADVVASNYDVIDEQDHVRGPRNREQPSGFIPVERIIRNFWEPIMLGAALAWRKKVYLDFPRLDALYLAGGHDSLIPFRGALGSGFYYASESLLRCRRFAAQWSHRLVDQSSKWTRSEGMAARALGVYVAMRSDLIHRARLGGSVERERIESLDRLVLNATAERAAEMFRVRNKLRGQGKRQQWVDAVAYEAHQEARLQMQFWNREPFRRFKDSLVELLEANHIR